jgi:L-2-hydroxyglutarate oxidase LhgO
MLESVDCVVVGAGVVGLAVARALALAGREVLVLERETQIGTHTSSRNSEVIHAGIYYPTDSLKARLCVAGRRALYPYCREHGVDAQACGKLIVASTGAEVDALARLMRHAERNGVEGLAWLDPKAARALEPELEVQAAIFSSTTGIIDSHAYMLALQGDAENAGATICTAAPVLGGWAEDGRIVLKVAGDGRIDLSCRSVVNAAGLFAGELADQLHGRRRPPPPTYYAKGSYFVWQGRSPFRHLVYPMPSASGALGVHVTLDLAGACRFGPDIQWIDTPDYGIDPARKADFAEAIRRYWPGVEEDRLAPGYVGVRPKLVGPKAPAADFMIADREHHGIDGLVELFGIESPGLTASLALGSEVAARLGQRSGDGP